LIFMTIKLAASSMLARGKFPAEQLEFLHGYGFSGMELRLTLSDDELPLHMDNLQQVMQTTDAKVCSLIAPDASFSMSFDGREAMEAKLHALERNLRFAGPLGAVSLFCPEYRAQQPLPLWNPPVAMTRMERSLLVECLSRAAEVAEKVDGKIVIEPLNRYETHLVHSLESAMEICELVGSSRVGILADFYHMNLEEADIGRSITATIDKIFHVQLGDSNRLLPGQGHMDYQSGFKALRRAGYDHFMALECRSRGPLEEDLPKCIQFLQDELAA
jgi:sugar phosphate isomerase/epimerase